MADSGVIAAVDTIDNPYDNALAKAVNSLHKSEVIHSLKQHWKAKLQCH